MSTCRSYERLSDWKMTASFEPRTREIYGAITKVHIVFSESGYLADSGTGCVQHKENGTNCFVVYFVISRFDRWGQPQQSADLFPCIDVGQKARPFYWPSGGHRQLRHHTMSGPVSKEVSQKAMPSAEGRCRSSRNIQEFHDIVAIDLAQGQIADCSQKGSQSLAAFCKQYA